MSVFAKVFIVINLILTFALVFLMGTLLAQKADYKAKAGEELRKKQDTRDELDRRKADFRLQVQNLGALNTKLVDDINTAKNKALEAQEAAKRWADANDDLNRQLEQLKYQEEQGRQHLDQANREVSSLTGESSRANGRKAKVEDLERQWAGKVNAHEQELRRISPPWRRK